jgi:uncharacterized repeat protein (TIGR03803 family)
MTMNARVQNPIRRRISIIVRRAALVAVAVITSLVSLPIAAWGVERVLHSFRDEPAEQPVAGLAFDSTGNLYGTTAFGGNTRCFNGCGTVFKLAPAAGGALSYSVLYSFRGGQDGAGPAGTITIDSFGNLYGTTQSGGSDSCSGGCGTVFELSPSPGGGWIENVLYRFDGVSGQQPYAGVILDSVGNIYGTTLVGGSGSCKDGCGVVFKLELSGQWSETVLYSFSGGSDGALPVAPLIFDAQGNLYGTAAQGGVGSCGGTVCGVVFELTSSGAGWTENVLYSFKGGKDGGSPNGGLIFDLTGNLYGTTGGGGSQTCRDGCGTVFELTPSAGGWAEAVLHRFQGGKDGASPYTVSLVFDPAGNLYGTTLLGGQGTCGCGTVFKLAPGSGGKWTKSSLYSFDGTHGGSPDTGVVIGAAGLYGTTASGGADGLGVVFEISP